MSHAFYDLHVIGAVSERLEFVRSEAFILFLRDNGLLNRTGPKCVGRFATSTNTHLILFHSASYDPTFR
jgi:hypothetical protein